MINTSTLELPKQIGVAQSQDIHEAKLPVAQESQLSSFQDRHSPIELSQLEIEAQKPWAEAYSFERIQEMQRHKRFDDLQDLLYLGKAVRRMITSDPEENTNKTFDFYRLLFTAQDSPKDFENLLQYFRQNMAHIDLGVIYRLTNVEDRIEYQERVKRSSDALSRMPEYQEYNQQEEQRAQEHRKARSK